MEITTSWIKKVRCAIKGHQWMELARDKNDNTRVEVVMFVCNDCLRTERHRINWAE